MHVLITLRSPACAPVIGRRSRWIVTTCPRRSGRRSRPPTGPWRPRATMRSPGTASPRGQVRDALGMTSAVRPPSARWPGLASTSAVTSTDKMDGRDLARHDRTTTSRGGLTAAAATGKIIGATCGRSASEPLALPTDGIARSHRSGHLREIRASLSVRHRRIAVAGTTVRFALQGPPAAIGCLDAGDGRMRPCASTPAISSPASPLLPSPRCCRRAPARPRSGLGRVHARRRSRAGQRPP